MEVKSSVSKTRMPGSESQLHSYIVFFFFFNLDKILFIYQRENQYLLKAT